MSDSKSSGKRRSAYEDKLMMVGYNGTKHINPREHNIQDLMALCYLQGAIGVLLAEKKYGHRETTQ